LANHPSALKRVKQSQARRLRNMSTKSRIKTTVKKFYQVLETGAMEAARPAMIQAIAQIDRAASKGVVHPRTASRKISRLSKKLHRHSVQSA
jgi:small subunit ribosomal protein S20